MTRERIENEYFEWLFDLVCEKTHTVVSYRKLISRLHSIPFRYSIHRDANRASDGVDLRRRFALEYDCVEAIDCLDYPCSVLEMIAALAIKCEESIMDDPAYGDRTRQWFWKMINNLGLGHMNDRFYDRYIVDEVIDRFLDREYEPDGQGGLFTIKNCGRDLRDVEIYYQLCWYLDTII